MKCIYRDNLRKGKEDCDHRPGNKNHGGMLIKRLKTKMDLKLKDNV